MFNGSGSASSLRYEMTKVVAARPAGTGPLRGSLRSPTLPKRHESVLGTPQGAESREYTSLLARFNQWCYISRPPDAAEFGSASGR